MKIGVFSGSFNPIHIGHAMLASYISQFSNLDEVWLSVTPQNPLKQNIAENHDRHRVKMAEIVAEELPNVQFTTIEFELPLPSYSINTLRALRTQYPEHEFCLIIGSDNWLCFDRWKDYTSILNEFGVLVYPRPGYDVKEIRNANAKLIDAPTIEISSTFIRQSIAQGYDMNFLLPERVYQYIKAHNLYRKNG